MSKNKNNDSVEMLLKIAGKRIQPEDSVKDEVYKNVYAVWKQQNKQHFYHNRMFLAAASMFVFVGFYSLYFLAIGDKSLINNSISQSIRLSGQIQVSHNENIWSYLKTDSTLKAGDYIKTSSNNRLLVELNNGNVFKLDENSTIQLVSENLISLKQGQIYIESNESIANNKLIIETDFGSINHIGTQYNVKLSPNDINVSVRKGKVVVHKDTLDKQIHHGFALLVDKKGVVKETKITSFDSTWSWTQKITASFDIQDKSITQYLTWLSNETGYPIQWDNNITKMAAKKITLSGSIKGVSPLESLSVIMPTTDFNYNISQVAIHISN